MKTKSNDFDYFSHRIKSISFFKLYNFFIILDQTDDYFFQ